MPMLYSLSIVDSLSPDEGDICQSPKSSMPPPRWIQIIEIGAVTDYGSSALGHSLCEDFGIVSSVKSDHIHSSDPNMISSNERDLVLRET